MAQTKKQRFKEQKRKKKQPAPVAQKSSSKTSTASSGGPKKVLIGAGALVAVAGVALAAILVFNPFGSKTEPVAAAAKPTAMAKATPVPVAQLAYNDPRKIRQDLIKDYRLMVDTDVADSVAKTCGTGKPAEITARSMGGTASSKGPSNGQYSVLCESAGLKVTDLSTKTELKPDK